MNFLLYFVTLLEDIGKYEMLNNEII